MSRGYNQEFIKKVKEKYDLQSSSKGVTNDLRKSCNDKDCKKRDSGRMDKQK